MTYIQREKIFLNNQESLSLISEGRYLEALNILKLLVESFKQTNEPSFEEVVSLNNLAQIHYNLNQPHFSLKYLSRASIFKPETPSEVLCKIGTHLNLSVINSTLGHITSAIQEGYKALELINQDEIPETAVIVNYNMATQFVNLKKPQKAAQFFKEAAFLAEKKLGPTHFLTKKANGACSNYFYKEKIQNDPKNVSISSKNISIFNNRPDQHFKDFTIRIISRSKESKSKTIPAVIVSNKITLKKKYDKNEMHLTEQKQDYTFDIKISNTPKSIRKRYFEHVTSSRSTAISSIGSSFAEKNASVVESRMKNISQYLSVLQNEINQFSSTSKAVMKTAQLENVTERSETK